MNKFNNTLAGTDCGDAGLPPHWHDVAKAKTILRVVPKTPDLAIKSGSDGVAMRSRPAPPRLGNENAKRRNITSP